MHSVETSAKTRKEAIQVALDQLGVEMHEVENIEILDEGSKGFFGFGSRPVRVKVSVKRALHQARAGGDKIRDRRERGPAPDRQDRGQRSQQGQQGQQGQRQERGPRPERQERPPQAGRSERGEGGAQPDRAPRADQGGRGEQNDRGRRGGRNRGGRPEQGGQQRRRENEPRGPEAQTPRPPREVREERPPRTDRPPRPDRTPRPDRPPRSAAVSSEPAPGGEHNPGNLSAPEIDAVPMTDEQGREAAALLQDVISKMGIEATVEYKRDADGSARLDVASPDSALLIGRKGRNLQAMQYIINRIIARADSNEVSERLLVDIEGYVDRRRESLEELAQNLAERAKATGRDVHLKPLSPQERRVVHLTLQGDPDVRTFSIGDTLHRIVVISPKNRRGGGGGRGFGGRPRGPRREDRYSEPRRGPEEEDRPPDERERATAPRREDRHSEPRPASEDGNNPVEERAQDRTPRRAPATTDGAPSVIMPAARAKRPPVKRRRGLRPLRYGPNTARPADGTEQPAASASANESGEHTEG